MRAFATCRGTRPDPPAPPVGKLSLIVFSGDYERVHYALAAAAAAAAIDRPATLFFTMEAARALCAGDGGEPGWHRLAGADADAERRARGVAGFDELLEACAELGVRFMACEMGLRAAGIAPESLRQDLRIDIAGLVSFYRDAEPDGAMLFI